MLVISPKQLRVLDDKAEADFVRNEKQDLLIRYPNRFIGITDTSLEQLVLAGIARARAYGLTWCSNLSTFLCSMVEISPNFDAEPVIHNALLRNRGGSADQKFRFLSSFTSSSAWRHAASLQSGIGWYLRDPLPQSAVSMRIALSLPMAVRSVYSLDGTEASKIAAAGLQHVHRLGSQDEDSAFLFAVLLALHSLKMANGTPQLNHQIWKPGDEESEKRWQKHIRKWLLNATNVWV
jgi:hypothetical protein